MPLQRHFSGKVVELVYLSALCTIIATQDFKSSSENKDDLHYRFQYLVRDDNTGDYKTQEESKVGNVVKGRYTVAEPNGDLRVVTYLADQHRGFQARVQIHPSSSSVQKVTNHTWGLPRFARRAGTFNGTLKPDNQMKDEGKETNHRSLLNNQHIADKENSQSKGNVANFENSFHNNGITEKIQLKQSSNYSEEPLHTYDNKTEELTLQKDKRDTSASKNGKQDANEGRAHIRPDEDKVQFEMEQVIRAEMQDPTTVKLGVPLDEHMRLHNMQTKYQTYSQFSNKTSLQQTLARLSLKVPHTHQIDSIGRNSSNTKKNHEEDNSHVENKGGRKQWNSDSKAAGFGTKTLKMTKSEGTTGPTPTTILGSIKMVTTAVP